ncbi:hypothetical protein HPB48_009400 [Haemaphysalis longicornis]|uniref:Uncharacterized protein n=1 Tax=Haemaphysalis longicornis TaxID=44386 RepID=A0A9J6GZ27_HAELO|nr:hypothetical protein HPB48_009400 [Haemaphysalis longicornis]
MAPPCRKDGRPSTAAATVATPKLDMILTARFGPPSRLRTAHRSCPNPSRAPRLLPRSLVGSRRATHLGRPPPTLRPRPRLPTRTLAPAPQQFRRLRRTPRARSGGTRGFCAILNPCRSRKQRPSSLCSNPGLSCPSPTLSPRTGPVARSSPTSERPRHG